MGYHNTHTDTTHRERMERERKRGGGGKREESRLERVANYSDMREKLAKGREGKMSEKKDWGGKKKKKKRERKQKRKIAHEGCSGVKKKGGSDSFKWRRGKEGKEYEDVK